MRPTPRLADNPQPGNLPPMTPTATPIHIEALRLSPGDDLRAALQGAW